MKAIRSIFRREPRPRAARPFAATCIRLEGRSLPTAGVAAPAPAIVGSLLAPDLPGPGRGGAPPGQLAPAPAATDLGGGKDPGPAGSPRNHVGMDVKPDGRGGVEVAIADESASEVFVRTGMDGPRIELGPEQGIDHPESVTLADLSDDGLLDLIVANTGADDVLVFPGLAGGQFGPAVGGDRGYAVGSEPVSVSVNYVDGNPKEADLIVADEGSGDVAILDGQYAGGTWTATPGGTIATGAGSSPVRAFVADLGGDGSPDLLVLDSGADAADVALYRGGANGSFDPTATTTYPVGDDPREILVGAFEKRSQLDLLTINAGSDDMTYIANAFGAHPTTQTIPSGGTTPDAAFAIDPNQSGVLDLVVANGGDGHVAVFKGGGDGLQLAGVINQVNVQAPTALAPASSVAGGIDFFAADAGDDAALLLHFDLGTASAYLPGSSGESAALGQQDGELYAQLMALDDSSLELVAVFWAGGADPDAGPSASAVREPSTITALYSPTEGQGGDQPGRLAEGSSEGPSPPIAGLAAPSGVGDETGWARFVLGVDAAFDRPRRLVAALAAGDALEDDLARPIGGLASIDLDRPRGDRLFEPDVEAVPGLVDEALRQYWSEGTPGEARAPLAPPSGIGPAPGPGLAPELDGGDAPSREARLEAIPLVSAALAASTRLILKATPPRPSTFGRRSGRRTFVSWGHDPAANPRPGPL